MVRYKTEDAENNTFPVGQEVMSSSDKHTVPDVAKY